MNLVVVVVVVFMFSFDKRISKTVIGIEMKLCKLIGFHYPVCNVIFCLHVM